MKCSCISVGCEDESEVLSEKTVTARRNYKCSECREIIAKGTKHKRLVSVYDRKISTTRTCLDCQSVIDHLFCDYFFGMIWENLRDEYWQYRDDIPWSRIALLTPKAREKVCQTIEDFWEDQE